MGKQGGVPTSRSWTQIKDDLVEELRMWGKDKDTLFSRYDDCRRTGSVTVLVDTAGGRVELTCSSQHTPEQNLVAILVEVRSARLAEARGIWGLRQQVARLALPPGASSAGKRSPYAVLGVPEGLRDRRLLELAYNDARRKAHPDAGGSDEAFIAVAEAAAAKELGL